MEDIVKEIIRFGSFAPSGENIQPWRVIINSPSEFSLYNDSSADLSLYNNNQIGSYIAHGAFLENITIGAHSLGKDIKIILFPSNDKNHIATISIVEGEVSHKEDIELAKYISTRCTNRKKQKKNLSVDKISELKASLKFLENEKFNVNITSVVNKEMADALAVNERLTFSKQEIHNFFFGHLRWNQKEVDDQITGMGIKTLELPQPVQILLRLLKNWKIMRKLNSFGISKKIAGESSKLFTNSGAIGAICSESSSPEDFIKVGRILERAWLKTTSLGLNFHPLGGIAILTHLASSRETNHLFSDKERLLLESAGKTLANLFNVRGKIVLFFFRLGEGTPPTARSPKKSLNLIIDTGK